MKIPISVSLAFEIMKLNISIYEIESTTFKTVPCACHSQVSLYTQISYDSLHLL